jgi:hypothetical protein
MIMKGKGIIGAVGGALLVGATYLALKNSDNGYGTIQPQRYGNMPAGISAQDYLGKLFSDAEWLEGEASSYESQATRDTPELWDKIGQYRRQAIEKYTEIVRRSPNSDIGRTAMDVLYGIEPDAVLQAAGKENTLSKNVNDTIPMGKGTVVINSVDRTHDTMVNYSLFDGDGKQVDASPMNPFSLNKTINLMPGDYTVGELVGQLSQ